MQFTKFKLNALRATTPFSNSTADLSATYLTVGVTADYLILYTSIFQLQKNPTNLTINLMPLGSCLFLFREYKKDYIQL